ncbi:hypothetical protein H4R34_005479, partial [Dimargaris verticillata]
CPPLMTAPSEPAAPSGPRMRRVCDRCSQRRFRCDGKLPCQSCIRRLYNCSYSPVARRKSTKQKAPSDPKPTKPTETTNAPPTHAVPAAGLSDPSQVAKPAQALVPRSRSTRITSGHTSTPAPVAPSNAGKPVPRAAPSILPSTPESIDEAPEPLDPLADPAYYAHPRYDAYLVTDGSEAGRQRQDYEAHLFYLMLAGQLTSSQLRASAASPVPGLRPDKHGSPRLAGQHSVVESGLKTPEEFVYHSEVIQPLLKFFFNTYVMWEPDRQHQRFMVRMKRGKLSPVLLNAVLAYAAQLCAYAQADRNALKFFQREYFVRGENAFWREMDAGPTVDTMVGAILLCYSACNFGNSGKVDTYGDLSIRLSTMLQLNTLDAPASSSAASSPAAPMTSASSSASSSLPTPRICSPFERVLRECQRRAFWMVSYCYAIPMVLGKVLPMTNFDSARVNAADDAELAGFFTLDDPDDRLPSLVPPLLTADACKAKDNAIVELLVAVTSFHSATKVHNRVKLADYQRVNQQLDEWLARYPITFDFKSMAAATTRSSPTSQEHRAASPRAETSGPLEYLSVLMYHLCMVRANCDYILNLLRQSYSISPGTKLESKEENAEEADTNASSTDALTPDKLDQLIAWGRSRSWASFEFMTDEIVPYLMQVPLEYRPVNCHVYSFIAFMDNAQYFASLSPERQRRHASKLQMVYTINYKNMDYSLFSRYILIQFKKTISGLKIRWSATEDSRFILLGSQGQNLCLDNTEDETRGVDLTQL